MSQFSSALAVIIVALAGFAVMTRMAWPHVREHGKLAAFLATLSVVVILGSWRFVGSARELVTYRVFTGAVLLSCFGVLFHCRAALAGLFDAVRFGRLPPAVVGLLTERTRMRFECLRRYRQAVVQILVDELAGERKTPADQRALAAYFSALTAEEIGFIAKYVNAELLVRKADVAEVARFLQSEKSLISGDAGLSYGHLRRLDAKFHIVDPKV